MTGILPKISIVIPVYNGEKYLDECIKSSLKQTYSNIEIIAVDDGSTDKSIKILKQYSDRIKIIQKQNGGTASALNLGIKKMSSEWFKWLSQDDILYPNAIEELVSESQKFPDDNNIIFYSNYKVIDSDGKFIKDFVEPDHSKLIPFKQNIILLNKFYGNINTSLIHRSTFEKYGLFDENIESASDYEFWLRLCILHRFKLKLIPKFLLKYRFHPQQLSKNIKKQIQESEQAKELVLSKLDPKNRKKYLIALKRYQKGPISFRTKKSIYNFITKISSPSSAQKVSRLYKKISSN